LRERESMIDEETERAVAGWVRLGDRMTDRRALDDRARCSRCGSVNRVLGRGPHVLCAHCYLERGEEDGS
jgi:hypothetical protein